MTNEQRILNYLKRVKQSTKQQMHRAIGIYECGEYISDLRKKGHRITCQLVDGINHNGRKIRYGVYIYKGKRK